MAEIAAAVGINIGCHMLITAVESLVKRVRTENDDADSGGRITKFLQQLNVVKSTLQDYQNLEEKGNVHYRDERGQWTTIGNAANTLCIFIKKCNDYEQSTGKRFWNKPSSKQLDKLQDELQNATRNLNDALLPILSEGKLKFLCVCFFE